MSDYEGQEQEDLEAYDDAHLDTIEEDEINRRLDILDQERMARENGEKPAGEWGRTDFKDLLHSYPKLRGLRTCELRAFFLRCEDYINGVKYYERVSGHNLYDTNLAVPPIVRRQMYENPYALQRWWFEDEKLWKMWRDFTREKRKSYRRVER